MNSNLPRIASLDDLQELVRLENLCFTHDRISKRSFRYFLTKSQAEIWVIDQSNSEKLSDGASSPLVAYGLVLFHRGTSLARIYSLAVAPQERGKGFARQLILTMEASARKHNALFIRLEVAEDNHGARKLYQSLGYEPIRRLHHYYEDGNDGFRLEKRLQIDRQIPSQLPYYTQTTEFTCGPASLLMAAKKLNPNQPVSQIEEFNIWREATTIFMTTGHGGTSPYGLAIAAHRRGYKARLWLANEDPPFLDSVRSPKKKKIIELIHHDFARQAQEYRIEVEPFPKDIEAIRQALRAGQQIILLISTYRMNRSKGPHWIWLVNLDDDFAYFNDPEVDEDEWKSAVDTVYVPVPISDFAKMIKYGRNQYRAAVLISFKEEKKAKRQVAEPAQTGPAKKRIN
ncbi:GNAT family N-acetyltransferase [Saccharophagus sp. K07]|jgi:ribosomal protein S18 acetylase RimI-like enzyme|uniref:GNAT family N-acetyltransferase/peptidase C39 family protein n=1 Tax=Saccharophagus sp. K07 TaxID=2283636 RepID=UPI001651B39F|nr:GNAT family N-acetyltransferase/peptidase C39 family protein [Saccharophagus sp. K07]MBC6905621.1 GNAT family N-acetyltransferase [Saccharophagus sp. K07]